MIRLVTSLALIVVALYLVWLAPAGAFVVAAFAVGCLCYWEFGNLAVAHGIERPGPIGVLIGVFMVFFPQWAFSASLLLLMVQLALELRQRNLRAILPEAACVLAGAFYSFATWRCAVDLRQASPGLLFFALALNWIGDSAAFYTGRKWGRHKLAPTVSPGKSWEGAIASAVASVLFGFLYLGKVMPAVTLVSVCAMSLVGNIAGQVGDLAESSIKRGAGLKDSGNVLPGHGGVLDRLDSSMFALPVVYFLYCVLPLN